MLIVCSSLVMAQSLHGAAVPPKDQLESTHKDLNSADPADSAAALFAAVEARDHVAFDALVARPGVDLACKDWRNRNLLHVACEQSDETMVKKLLTHRGFDVEVTDNWGNSPAHYTTNATIRDILAKHPVDGMSPLHKACEKNDEKNVQELIESCKDSRERTALVMARDARGNSPAHYARSRNCHRVLRHLVDAGADLNVINSAGQTPLFVAVNNQDIFLLEALVCCGADIEKKCAGTLSGARHKTPYEWIGKYQESRPCPWHSDPSYQPTVAEIKKYYEEQLNLEAMGWFLMGIQCAKRNIPVAIPVESSSVQESRQEAASDSGN